MGKRESNVEKMGTIKKKTLQEGGKDLKMEVSNAK